MLRFVAVSYEALPPPSRNASLHRQCVTHVPGRFCYLCPRSVTLLFRLNDGDLTSDNLPRIVLG